MTSLMASMTNLRRRSRVVQISCMVPLAAGTGTRGRIHVFARLVRKVLVDDRTGPAAEAIVKVVSLRLLERLGGGILASEAGVLQFTVDAARAGIPARGTATRITADLSGRSTSSVVAGASVAGASVALVKTVGAGGRVSIAASIATRQTTSTDTTAGATVIVVSDTTVIGAIAATTASVSRASRGIAAGLVARTTSVVGAAARTGGVVCVFILAHEATASAAVIGSSGVVVGIHGVFRSTEMKPDEEFVVKRMGLNVLVVRLNAWKRACLDHWQRRSSPTDINVFGLGPMTQQGNTLAEGILFPD
jgi:hypothetical protein